MIHDRKNSQLKWQIFLTLVLALCMAGWNYSTAVAAGITYYVNNTNVLCNDAGIGTLAAPFCTIGKGASVAVAGDTVRVLAGTYAETVNGTNSGSVGLPITYSAAPGVTVTGNGTATGNAFRMSGKSYIVVDGFTITGTVDYGIYTFGSNNITISNNHVSNSGTPLSGSTRAGIYINSTTNSMISGNTTDHNSSHGIMLTNGSNNNLVSNNVSFANAEQWQRNANGIQVNSATGTNNTILHNITYANEDTGLQFYTGATNNIVAGNLSYGNGDHGIDFNAAPNNIVVGNTVQGNVTSGINFEGVSAPGSGGATVMNNILVDNGLRLQVGGGTASGQPGNLRFDANSLTGNTLDYNLYYLNSGTVQITWGATDYTILTAFQGAVTGQETHGVQANPLLMAPASVAQRPSAAPFNVAVNAGNYHLTAGSPAIDSANANASNEPTLDIAGNARVDDPSTTDSGAGTRTYDDRGAYEFQLELPTVTTQAVTAIGTTTATGNGNITSLGVPNPTQHGVVWSTLANPTIADNKTTDGPVSVTGAFTSNITGLTAGALYHVRAYATNFVDTAYGADVTFSARTYIVTFNANGGTGSMSTQTSFSATALTANTFTRIGYTFSGWNTTVNGSGTAYANGAVYPFTADATLYAQWTI
ncbi:MAG: right-handed parallel beta-helix repeat-containing protein, partial [Chloroflexota bacterium]